MQEAYDLCNRHQMGIGRNWLPVAVVLAHTRYEGEENNIELALYHIYSNGLAVYVNNDRDAFNEQWARGMLARRIARDEESQS